MNKILIVEDEEIISELIKTELENAGYKCETVNNRRNCSRLYRRKRIWFSFIRYNDTWNRWIRTLRIYKTNKRDSNNLSYSKKPAKR